MDYDILIVGSGPAGSSTALNLAQKDPRLAGRTAILEQGQHPRHKLCAGALVPDVDVCLRKVDLSIEDVPHIKVPWVHSRFEGRGTRLRLAGELAFRICQRTQFDGWLAEQAQRRGVAIHQDTKVLSVTPIEGGVEVQTNRGAYHARAVVGADGAKSTVRRAVLNKRPDGGASVARLIEVLTELPAFGQEVQTPALEGDEAAIELGWLPQGIQGYVWDFPAERQGQRRRNRGVYDSRTVPRAAAAPLPQVLDSELGKCGQRLADYELLGAPLRWFDPRAPFAAPHILLAGDAAGVDAAFGEGISSALGYGEIVAAELCASFTSGDLSFDGYRRRLLRSRLGRALRRRTSTAKLFFRLRSPTVQRLLWWHMAPMMRWFIRNFVFNWARPAPESAPEHIAMT